MASELSEADLELVREAARDAVQEAAARHAGGVHPGVVESVEGPLARVQMDDGGVDGLDPPGIVSAARMHPGIGPGARVLIEFTLGGVRAWGPVAQPPHPATAPTLVFVGSHSVAQGAPTAAQMGVQVEAGDSIEWEMVDGELRLPEGGLFDVLFACSFAPHISGGIRWAWVQEGNATICGDTGPGVGLLGSYLSGGMTRLVPEGGSLALSVLHTASASLVVQSRLSVRRIGDLPVVEDPETVG